MQNRIEHDEKSIFSFLHFIFYASTKQVITTILASSEIVFGISLQHDVTLSVEIDCDILIKRYTLSLPVSHLKKIFDIKSKIIQIFMENFKMLNFSF